MASLGPIGSAWSLPALMLAVVLAAPAAAQPQEEIGSAPGLAEGAPGSESSPVAFRSHARERLIQEPTPRLQPLAALLRAALAAEDVRRFHVDAEETRDLPHGPAARQRWRVVLGWRWNY